MFDENRQIATAAKEGSHSVDRESPARVTRYPDNGHDFLL
jgi:hypothetical protein